MAVTELVVANLKNDAESRAEFEKAWPAISKIFESTPALVNGLYGRVVDESGAELKDEFKLLLLFGASTSLRYPGIALRIDTGCQCKVDTDMITLPEWDKEESFHAFIASPGYTSMSGLVKPFALAPTKPQLYSTSSGIGNQGRGALTEIVKIKPSAGIQSAEEAWKNARDILGKQLGKPVREVHGKSIGGDGEEEKFMGVLDWDSLEVSCSWTGGGLW